MPIPVIVAKLVAAAPKIIAIGSAVRGLGAGQRAANKVQNKKNMDNMLAVIEQRKQEYASLSPEDRQKWKSETEFLQSTGKSKTPINSDEQIYDSTTGTEKAFLGLQTVEAGKKQQTKIIMIAGGVLLLLFFFMKKK